MPDPTPASVQLLRWRVVGIVLFVVGMLVIVLGWPRRIDCVDELSMCDGRSGDRAAVYVGAVLVLLSMFPLAVQAAALGYRLQREIDREADRQAPPS